MITRRFVAVSVVALAFTLPVFSNQEPMDEEAYAKAMIEIRYLMQDVSLHIDARYWPDLTEDVMKLNAQFEKVEAFWEARGATDAVKIAQGAIAALEPILVAGDARSTDSARAAVRALVVSCQSCHQQFREETADGFRIKP